MERNNKTKASKILYAIIFVILCALLYFTYQYYKINNFNRFVRSEAHMYSSVFKRDKDEKYGKQASYKIESPEYNDAMFYETIEVEKNQPYRVTCMVKTENVEPKEPISSIGAQISIEGSTERSVAVQGTTKWQKIELIFNSKDRTSINLGFRLGGNSGEAKGTAWFSEFTLEEGINDNNNEWKFGCFIFQKTDVAVNGKQVQVQVTQNDISDISKTISRFSSSCEILSNGKMKAICDIYEIDKPITELSYDDEFGYYVSPENIEEQIKDIIATHDYDHIFAIMRLGDEKHSNDIEINDWIGLRSDGLLWYRILQYTITK